MSFLFFSQVWVTSESLNSM